MYEVIIQILEEKNRYKIAFRIMFLNLNTIEDFD